jgi:hypothetical protein
VKDYAALIGLDAKTIGTHSLRSAFRPSPPMAGCLVLGAQVLPVLKVNRVLGEACSELSIMAAQNLRLCAGAQ